MLLENTKAHLQFQGVNLDYSKIILLILFPWSSDSFRNGYNTLFWTWSHERKSANDRIHSGKYSQVLARSEEEIVSISASGIYAIALFCPQRELPMHPGRADRFLKTWVPDYVLQSLS